MTTAVLITHSTKEAFYMSIKLHLLVMGLYTSMILIQYLPQTSIKEIANFLNNKFHQGIVCGPNHVQTVVGKLFGNTEKVQAGSGS